MKKLLLFLIVLCISMSTKSQHLYLVVVKNIHSLDSAKLVCDAFHDLSAIECTYSEHYDYFKVKTKNMLPEPIAKPYLSGLGFEISFYSEIEEKPMFFRLPPNKKDSIKR